MRVLQVGYGVIGREVFRDYSTLLSGDGMRYMVTDLLEEAPEGHEYDGGPVDVAVILVNTPRSLGGGFDHRDLLSALAEYEPVAEHLLIRSTVSPAFLQTNFYRDHRDRIGFAPEFYGATAWSRRAVLDMGFSIFTRNVPEWFRDRVAEGDVLLGEPIDVILAKLAENAYLATKVTFFHELHLAAESWGADPEVVRQMVASDPRIGHGHTFMREPGWQSHCFDKDVPEYAAFARSDLVAAAIETNRDRLLPLRGNR